MKLFCPPQLQDNPQAPLAKVRAALESIHDDLASRSFDEISQRLMEQLKALAYNDLKKDNDFKALSATAIYYLAYLHHNQGASDRAEGELAKALPIFESLAKKSPEKYDAALLTAVEASTVIFKSRLKQLNTLAHYQVAIDTYAANLSEGGTKALNNLINSLSKEADLLLKMGNYRQSVKFYSQALKYLRKRDKQMGITHLKISINLGKAMLNLFNRQDTARQLLQSLIPLAVSLNAPDQLEEIEYTLANAPQKDFIDKIKLIFK